MRIELSKQAQKSFLKMDANTQKRVITALRGLETFPQTGDIKKLHGKSDEYRLRVGDYRIVFINLPEYVYIIDIDTRGQIYK